MCVVVLRIFNATLEMEMFYIETCGPSMSLLQLVSALKPSFLPALIHPVGVCPRQLSTLKYREGCQNSLLIPSNL